MSSNICNNCGGNYEYRNGRWKCRSCGAFKPEEISNEEVTLLYNAAQKLRLSNFSEAEEAYSDIIEKYPKNSNAYWGRLLSKYGIKYEDDFDGRKIPTCYAVSIKSVIDDADYSKAIELADAESKDYYEQQAQYIERVRKEWIEKAQKEKPYDVFICYKDSDLEKGIERTADSVVAQDLYIHLTEQGYRVFYSRESLRGKVGEKYEPYIFNALATAKVMLVYGSSAEYIKSTWLKNEWHRFYKKITSGDKHSEALIVACDGFSPSELPTILSSRQCLDAKRKTFFLDLDKCIERIIQESPKAETPYAGKEEKYFSGLHEHKYKTKIIKSTCIAKGYTIHKCDCGYEYRDSYTPLVDHIFKVTNCVAPSCETDGFEEKVCEICGEKTTSSLPALSHKYSNWVETARPTCTENGESQRQCSRCGATEIHPLPKTGHQFGGWSESPDGTQTSYCVKCGHTITREYVSNATASKRKGKQAFADFTEACVPLSTVFKNFGTYFIELFAKKWSKGQKLRRVLGFAFLVAIIIICIPGFTVGSAPEAEPPAWGTVLTSIGALLIIGLVPFSIYTIIVSIKETVYNKRNNLAPHKSQNIRKGFGVATLILIFFDLLFGLSMLSDMSLTHLFASMVTWTLFCGFFAFCPKQSKKISIFTKIRIPKFAFVLLAIALTFVLIITDGSASQ